MKEGYTIQNIGYSSCYKFIEVCNYIETNIVFNFTWVNYASCLNVREKETIGVWKIKNK